jgi:hypothetical protein
MSGASSATLKPNDAHENCPSQSWESLLKDEDDTMHPSIHYTASKTYIHIYRCEPITSFSRYVLIRKR